MHSWTDCVCVYCWLKLIINENEKYVYITYAAGHTYSNNSNILIVSLRTEKNAFRLNKKKNDKCNKNYFRPQPNVTL